MSATVRTPVIRRSLQVELIGCLGGDEFHRRALHGLGNRLGIPEIVFLPFAIGAHVFRGHQPCIVTKPLQLAAQVMCADTGLHADQTAALRPARVTTSGER